MDARAASVAATACRTSSTDESRPDCAWKNVTLALPTEEALVLKMAKRKDNPAVLSSMRAASSSPYHA